MGHLAYAYTAHSGGNEVVDCWRFYLTGGLPHQTTTKGIGHRLPKIESVAACSIEIESTMIGMSKEVGRKLVVVPHKACLEIMMDGMEIDFCEVGIEYKTVETLYKDIDTKGFGSCHPRPFHLIGGIVVGVNGGSCWLCKWIVIVVGG